MTTLLCLAKVVVVSRPAAQLLGLALSRSAGQRQARVAPDVISQLWPPPMVLPMQLLAVLVGKKGGSGAAGSPAAVARGPALGPGVLLLRLVHQGHLVCQQACSNAILALLVRLAGLAA